MSIKLSVRQTLSSTLTTQSSLLILIDLIFGYSAHCKYLKYIVHAAQQAEVSWSGFLSYTLYFYVGCESWITHDIRNIVWLDTFTVWLSLENRKYKFIVTFGGTGPWVLTCSSHHISISFISSCFCWKQTSFARTNGSCACSLYAVWFLLPLVLGSYETQFGSFLNVYVNKQLLLKLDMTTSSHFSSRTVTSGTSEASETSSGTSSSDHFWHYHWIPPHFMASELFTELR